MLTTYQIGTKLRWFDVTKKIITGTVEEAYPANLNYNAEYYKIKGKHVGLKELKHGHVVVMRGGCK